MEAWGTLEKKKDVKNILAKLLGCESLVTQMLFKHQLNYFTNDH